MARERGSAPDETASTWHGACSSSHAQMEKDGDKRVLVSAPVKAGTRLGARYRLVRRLGQGGMGQVWLARDERLGRDVAIKTLLDAHGGGTDALRLRREARATAALGQRGIAQVHDIEATPDGLIYVVMERIEGRTLRERLAKDGPLPVEDVRAILREVSATLQVAHDAGLVHRDIKPANLMQRPDGSVVVLDFGLAKDLSPTTLTEGEAPTEPHLTDSGAMLGTPAYLSPEQARGEKIGPATDQWSLAVSAYELLTGRLPWDADTVPQLLIGILEEEPPLASEVRKDVPLELAERLGYGMAKEPGDRLARIEEIGSASASPEPRATPSVLRRRQGVLLGLAGYAVVFLLYGRTGPVLQPLEQIGPTSVTDGGLRIDAPDLVTPLREGWSVETDAGWVPFDDELDFAAQGLEARARVRYRTQLLFPPEDLPRMREQGLSLVHPFTWQTVSASAGEGPERPCRRDFVFSVCIVEGLERALQEDGSLELTVTVEVPEWTTVPAPSFAHLRPERRVHGEVCTAPTGMARHLHSLIHGPRGQWNELPLLLALFFALLGFTRSELTHYRYMAALMASGFLIGAHNSIHWAWLFPSDPWPINYFLGSLLYPLTAVTALEALPHLLAWPRGMVLRGSQLLSVGVAVTGICLADGLGYLLVTLSQTVSLPTIVAATVVGLRRGHPNAPPFLWFIGVWAIVAVTSILQMLGLSDFGVWAYGGTLGICLLFGYIAARDMFAARLSLEEANRSLERRVEERTAALARANARLTELDQAKTRFFENVSHELRTPLTLILGPLQKLLGEEKVEAPTRGPVELAVKHSRRLLRMVNRLLDVQRLDAGRMHLDARRTDLSALARRVAGGFAEAAGNRELTLTVDADQPVEADVDPRLFEDVLFNLLSNAIKFTPRGGRIRVTVTEDGRSRRPVRLEVRDSGRGIPKAQLASIFERFRRVESRHRSGGTGVGLALVKELVSAHRGTVAVESEEGFGATFVIRLPAARLDANVQTPGLDADRLALELADLDETEVAVDASGPAEDAPRVLLVDDHRDLRAYVRSCLEPAYRVIDAKDGREALDLLDEAEHVDAVVSDVMMPRMDGYELLDHIRSTPALSELPVVLLTAKSSVDMRVEGLEAGADDYVSKPFDPAELRVRLRNVIRLRGGRSA